MAWPCTGTSEWGEYMEGSSAPAMPHVHCYTAWKAALHLQCFTYNATLHGRHLPTCNAELAGLIDEVVEQVEELLQRRPLAMS